MKRIKYAILALIMVSFGVGGYVQLATSTTHITPMPDVIASYNAFVQWAISIIIFVWLAHKAISRYEVKLAHPVTNARDDKVKK